jgi:hypothetical protein
VLGSFQVEADEIEEDKKSSVVEEIVRKVS